MVMPSEGSAKEGRDNPIVCSRSDPNANGRQIWLRLRIERNHRPTERPIPLVLERVEYLARTRTRRDAETDARSYAVGLRIIGKKSLKRVRQAEHRAADS